MESFVQKCVTIYSKLHQVIQYMYVSIACLLRAFQLLFVFVAECTGGETVLSAGENGHVSVSSYNPLSLLQQVIRILVQ